MMVQKFKKLFTNICSDVSGIWGVKPENFSFAVSLAAFPVLSFGHTFLVAAGMFETRIR